MLNSLIRLLSDSDVENRLMQVAERYLAPFKSLYSSFEDKGDSYELSFDVASDATSKNVTVDYDSESNEVTVSYEYHSKSVTSSTKFTETLPEDADADTLSATVEDGKFTLTVDKVVPVEDVDDTADVDPINVTIRRK